MVINQRFFISGFKSMLHGSPNMDTLVALGSGAAFLYSTYALFAMTDAQVRMDMDGVMHYMHEFYFESAAMILTLITIGKMLEAHSKGKTTDALKSLMKLAASTTKQSAKAANWGCRSKNLQKSGRTNSTPTATSSTCSAPPWSRGRPNTSPNSSTWFRRSWTTGTPTPQKTAAYTLK